MQLAFAWALARFATAIPALAARGLHALRLRWLERRTATALSALDDRMLKDIGIRRAEVPASRTRPGASR